MKKKIVAALLFIGLLFGGATAVQAESNAEAANPTQEQTPALLDDAQDTVTMRIRYRLLMLDGNPVVKDYTITGVRGTSVTIILEPVVVDGVTYVWNGYDTQSTFKFGDFSQRDFMYVELKKTITGNDFTMYLGDPEPTADDFNIVTLDNFGKPMAVTGDFSKVNYGVPGTYPVTFNSKDNQTITVNLTIEGSLATFTGDSPTTVVGTPLKDSDFNIWVTDNKGNVLGYYLDTTQVEYDRVGFYPVIAYTDDGRSIDLGVTVRDINYSIAFDANGGTGTMNNVDVIENADTTLPENAFAKEGYTFKGWSTSSNGDPIYFDKQTVSKLATKDGETVTLYAVWEKDPVIPVDPVDPVTPIDPKPITVNPVINQPVTANNNQSFVFVDPATKLASANKSTSESFPKTGETDNDVLLIVGLSFLAVVFGAVLYLKKEEAE